MQIRSVLIVAVLFFSCNNQGPEDKNGAQDTIMTDENSFLSPYDKLIWISDFDTVKNEFSLKKQRIVNADTLSPVNLISEINGAWENVKLVFVKMSGDTVFVSIPDSGFLTSQMGSAGSEAYMASTTYNLTELKGIRYVHYDFEEGDHVSPGTYGRQDYEDFR